MPCKEQKDFAAMMQVLLPAQKSVKCGPFDPLRPQLRDCGQMSDVDQTKVLHKALISDRILPLLGRGHAGTKELVEACKAIVAAFCDKKLLDDVGALMKAAMVEISSSALALLCLMNVRKTQEDQKQLEQLLVAKAGSGIVVKQARRTKFCSFPLRTRTKNLQTLSHPRLDQDVCSPQHHFLGIGACRTKVGAQAPSNGNTLPRAQSQISCQSVKPQSPTESLGLLSLSL